VFKFFLALLALPQTLCTQYTTHTHAPHTCLSHTVSLGLYPIIIILTSRPPRSLSLLASPPDHRQRKMETEAEQPAAAATTTTEAEAPAEATAAPSKKREREEETVAAVEEEGGNKKTAVEGDETKEAVSSWDGYDA